MFFFLQTIHLWVFLSYYFKSIQLHGSISNTYSNVVGIKGKIVFRTKVLIRFKCRNIVHSSYSKRILNYQKLVVNVTLMWSKGIQMSHCMWIRITHQVNKWLHSFYTSLVIESRFLKHHQCWNDLLLHNLVWMTEILSISTSYQCSWCTDSAKHWGWEISWGLSSFWSILLALHEDKFLNLLQSWSAKILTVFRWMWLLYFWSQLFFSKKSQDYPPCCWEDKRQKKK